MVSGDAASVYAEDNTTLQKRYRKSIKRQSTKPLLKTEEKVEDKKEERNNSYFRE
jgi:hypothetical protein